MRVYSELLEKGAYPSVQSRIAALYYVETERSRLWNDICEPTAHQKAVYEEMANSIELLKSVINKKDGSRFREKVVFFRETLHRVEENLLLFKKREQLLAESEEIRDFIALSELPENIRRNLLDKVEEAARSFRESKEDFPPGVLLLRKALHCLNDFLDEIYRDMYFVKIAVSAHSIALAVNFLFLGLCYLAYKGSFGPLFQLDPAVAFYFFVFLLGASGGSVGAMLGEIQPSSGKGTFLINLLTTVASRVLVGAASALGTVLIIKSELLVRITANSDGASGIVVSKPFFALLAVSFVAGIGGERWLRSSVDQLIAKLTVSATKNKGDGSKAPRTQTKHPLEERINAILANTETMKATAGDDNMAD